LAQRALVER